MPSDALLASQGQSEYSNYEPGYMRIEQSDWSGGRGLNDLDKDKTRYYDASRVMPISDGIMPGPQIHYANGFNTENKYLPDDNTANNHASVQLYGDNRYCSTVAFDPGSANYDALYVEFFISKKGHPVH